MIELFSLQCFRIFDEPSITDNEISCNTTPVNNFLSAVSSTTRFSEKGNIIKYLPSTHSVSEHPDAQNTIIE